jgi:hypothetical protein
MKKLIVGSLVCVLASAGLAVAQPPSFLGQPTMPAAQPGLAVSTTQSVPAGPHNFAGPLGPDLVVPLGPTHGGGESPDGCGPLCPHWHNIVEPCCPWYGNVEYLLMWAKNGPVDTPLVTAANCPCDRFPGALGQPETIVLFGAGHPLDFGATSGTRFTLGYWFDRQGTVGIEGTGLIMEQRSSNAHFSSNGSGSPLLGSPFFNTNLGREDFNDVAIPGIAVGTINISSYSQLYGFEINLVDSLYRDECWNVEILGGFRFLGLDEGLTYADATTAAPGFSSFFQGTAFPPPAITTVNDTFIAHNHFYGANMGGRVDYKTNNWLLGAGLRVALGDSREEIDIRGFSSLFVGPVGPVATTAGGIYTGPNNIGRRSEDTFAAVPQVDLKVGYQFNCHLTAYVGYMFMYWSDVVRPGDQIDHNVNPNRVPTFIEFGQPGGAANPLPLFTHTDYWIQGVTFGVEVKF